MDRRPEACAARGEGAARDCPPRAYGDGGIVATIVDIARRSIFREQRLCRFLGLAGGMPRQLVQCTAVYAFYDGHTPKSDVKSLPPTECEPEPGGLTRAIFSLRRQFLHMEPHSSVQLVVEVQQVAALPSPPAPSSAPATRIPHAHAHSCLRTRVVAPPSVAGGVAKTTSLGWTSIPVFHQRALNAGFGSSSCTDLQSRWARRSSSGWRSARRLSLYG